MSGDWRTWDRDMLERQLSPSSCLPGGDLRPFLDEYRRRSDAALAEAPVPPRLAVPYGDHPDEVLDLFLPRGGPPLGGPAPVVVYVHGGYWQELGRENSRFAAASLARAGIACAVVGYTLAPHATLEQIVDQVCRAVTHLRTHGPLHGLDPRHTVLAGSSAGGHLCAIAAVRGAAAPEAGLVLFSPVLDLEPLVGTSIDASLGLDPERARSLSPLHLAVAPNPTLLVVGEHETDEFVRQSAQYATRLRRQGVAVLEHRAAGANHFDVVHLLGEPASPVRRWIAAHLTTGGD